MNSSPSHLTPQTKISNSMIKQISKTAEKFSDLSNLNSHLISIERQPTGNTHEIQTLRILKNMLLQIAQILKSNKLVNDNTSILALSSFTYFVKLANKEIEEALGISDPKADLYYELFRLICNSNIIKVQNKDYRYTALNMNNAATLLSIQNKDRIIESHRHLMELGLSTDIRNNSFIMSVNKDVKNIFTQIVDQLVQI